MNVKQKFIQDYGPLANDIAQATGLEPGTVLGQLAVESGWGQHQIGNNPFGISYGGHVNSFPSVPAAAQAYVDLMRNRYQNAIQANGVPDQALMITRDGYAGPDRFYGDKVVAAANEAKSLGFKPEGNDQQSLEEAGSKLFTQMTGMTLGSTQEKQPANSSTVDVSSDNMEDAGRELFKQMTGHDLDGPVPEASQAPEQQSANEPTVPGMAQSHSMLQSVGAGLKMGAEDVANTVVPAITNELNKSPLAHSAGLASPAFAGISNAVQNFFSPQQIQQREQAFDQNYGDLPSLIGRAGGELGTSMLLTAPIGMAGEGALAAASNPLLRTGIRLGTGALQGATASAATGGNPLTGAVGGGVLGAAGGLAQPLGNLATKVLSNKVAGLVASYAGLHLGLDADTLVSLIAGKGIGEAINDVAKKYGTKAASVISDAIQKANTSGLSTGAAGIATNKAAKAVEPIPGQ